MIPAWNNSGLLPPIRQNRPGHDSDRSPYQVELHQVVERFAVTPDRIAILQGLFAYRKALHALGIEQGFQWLDGSFMEQVESLESRSPRDIDVVTFFRLPGGMDQRSLAARHMDLFIPEQTKAQYKVDAYPCILGEPTAGRHVRQIAYWYSMWSHRRNGMWKGFLQVDLAPHGDPPACKALELVQQEGGQP
jgi:hypothetical protein